MVIDKTVLKQLLLYGVIGGISAGLDMGVFYGLNTLLAVNIYIANTISIHCGIILSFILNSRYNFKKTDKLTKRALAFYLTGLFGLLLSSLILSLGMKLQISINIIKLFSIFFVAGIQFIINKFFTFRK